MKPGDFDCRWFDLRRVELLQPAGYIVIAPFTASSSPSAERPVILEEEYITFNKANSYLNFCAWKRRTMPYLNFAEATKRIAAEWKLLISSDKDKFKKSSEVHLMSEIFV